SRQFFQKQNSFADKGTISSRVRKLADGNRITRCLQTLHRAGSQSGSVANSVRKFHSAHCKHSQFSQRHARATAPGCRRQRSRGADLSRQSEFRQLSRIESRNRLQRIPRPGKFHVPSANKHRGLRARLGALPLERVEADRLSKSDRRLVGSTLNLTKRRSTMPTTTTAPTATETTASPATAKGAKPRKPLPAPNSDFYYLY